MGLVLILQIACQDLQGIVNAVHMAALIAVAGVDAGADETVADIRAGMEGSAHVGCESGTGERLGIVQTAV